MEFSFIVLLIVNLIIFKNEGLFYKLFGLYDFPDEKRKIHKIPISLAGGFIVLINFVIGSIIVINENVIQNHLLIIFFSILFYLVGYFDDKNNIKPLKKTFLNILLISTFLIISEYFILENLKSLYFSNLISLNNYSLFFTVFCFISFLNALNMYDGINGQSGIYLLFLFIYLLIICKNLFFIILILPIILFIYLNFRNKCFFGNSGINFMSFIVFVFFVNTYHLGYFKSIDEILILMLLPGIEMARLFFFRMSKLQSPFMADNQHLHHLLLKFFDSRNVVIITSLFSITPIFLFNFFDFSYWVILILLFVYFCTIIFLQKKIKS